MSSMKNDKAMILTKKVSGIYLFNLSLYRERKRKVLKSMLKTSWLPASRPVLNRSFKRLEMLSGISTETSTIKSPTKSSVLCVKKWISDTQKMSYKIFTHTWTLMVEELSAIMSSQSSLMRSAWALILTQTNSRKEMKWMFFTKINNFSTKRGLRARINPKSWTCTSRSRNAAASN